MWPLTLTPSISTCGTRATYRPTLRTLLDLHPKTYGRRSDHKRLHGRGCAGCDCGRWLGAWYEDLAGNIVSDREILLKTTMIQRTRVLIPGMERLLRGLLRQRVEYYWCARRRTKRESVIISSNFRPAPHFMLFGQERIRAESIFSMQALALLSRH